MNSQEVDEYWTELLNRNGLKSIIPPSEFVSHDLTEGYILLDFWMRNGVIVNKEEFEIIRDIEF